MTQTASDVVSAREKLYGPRRLVNMARATQRMQKNNLIWKGEPYDNDEDLDSVTALSFRNPPPNSETATARWSSAAQQDTNFCLGHNRSSPALKLKSATQADYTGESVTKVAPLIPEGLNDVHVADLAPQYMDDKSLGKSIYNDSYQGKDSFRFWLEQVEKEGPPTQRRNKTTMYQKATHFSLGSSQERADTETGSCYSGPMASGSGSIKTTSSTEGKTHSSVFRPGDYDNSGRDEFISIQRKDYTLPSERKLPSTFGAGVSTKTKNPKSHITERKPAISGETISALRKLLIEQNQSEFQNPRDPTSINLTKAFNKFDVDRAGSISADQLKTVCQSVGATQDEIDALLKECDKTADGKINYVEFGKYLTAHSEPVDEGSYMSTHMDSYRDSGPQLDTDEDCFGATYHTTAHFKLGNSREEPSSVYHKDFAKNLQLRKTPRAPQPPSGKVIAEQPQFMAVGAGNSTKQVHYVPHGVVEERLDNIQLNSDRHTRVSVVISCDKESEKQSRQASVMGSSYRGAPAKPSKSLHVLGEGKKHLESNRALLKPPKDFDRTEFQKSYQQPITDPGQAVQLQTESLTERTARRGDNKRTHFILGSDVTSNTTEHSVQFEPKHQEVDVPVAGRKEGISQGYSIIPEEDNQQELEQGEHESGTPLQNVLQQRNYLRHINPRDPLNLNLRKCFLEYDKNLSGTITVDELRAVCKAMKIAVDEATLQGLIQRCGTNQDGMIDYHEFSMYLSNKGLPSRDSKTFNTVFREDYRDPCSQRMTGMQKLVAEQESRRHKPIHSTHFFHLDYSDEAPLSTTRKDYKEPERGL